MDVNIESLGKKVITSGTFITFSEGENLISFDFKGEKFRFYLNFSHDDKKKTDLTFTESKDKNALVIDFCNFNNALETGLTKPVKVAKTKEDSEIHLQIFVSAINNDSKKVTYTFYEVK